MVSINQKIGKRIFSLDFKKKICYNIYINNSNKKELLQIEGNGLTLYDINKAALASIPSKTTYLELEPCRALLREFKKLGYYMLLCREKNYYTVIQVQGIKVKNKDKFEDIIIELLQSQGEIKELNYNEDKSAIECWVVSSDEVNMFLLFPYSWGVVRCK